jgi:hypothetical protein
MRFRALGFSAALALAISALVAALDLAPSSGLQNGKFKADDYVSAAIELQKLGHDPACQKLLRSAQSTGAGLNIPPLCRMLFCKRPNSEFRRAAKGGAQFLGDTDYSDWPLEPIALVDGVPFLITQGYVLAGFPESDEAYVRYCITECDWSTEIFSEPTREQKRDALAKLLASGKWKRPLNKQEQDFLADQVR